MCDKTRKVADEINYLGVTLENRGGLNRQKTRTIVKGHQTLTAIDNTLARTSDIKENILENVLVY
jgi:hypothetical protein